MNTAITEVILAAKRWSIEMQELRLIALDCGLDEAVKWTQPCYMMGGKNLFIIGPLQSLLRPDVLQGRANARS